MEKVDADVCFATTIYKQVNNFFFLMYLYKIILLILVFIIFR